MRVTRLTFHAARARVGATPRHHRARPSGRALERVLRARTGEGVASSRRGRVHERHGGGGAVPRRGRGVTGARAALPADGRPSPAAARHRREPDDRPGAVVRRRTRARTSSRPSRRRRPTRSGGEPSGARRSRRAAARNPDPCTSTARSRNRWCRPETSSRCPHGIPSACPGPIATRNRSRPTSTAPRRSCPACAASWSPDRTGGCRRARWRSWPAAAVAAAGGTRVGAAAAGVGRSRPVSRCSRRTGSSNGTGRRSCCRSAPRRRRARPNVRRRRRAARGGRPLPPGPRPGTPCDVATARPIRIGSRRS